MKSSRPLSREEQEFVAGIYQRSAEFIQLVACQRYPVPKNTAKTPDAPTS